MKNKPPQCQHPGCHPPCHRQNDGEYYRNKFDTADGESVLVVCVLSLANPVLQDIAGITDTV